LVRTRQTHYGEGFLDESEKISRRIAKIKLTRLCNSEKNTMS
jgi:hypothetical protein